jgi:hypothetical protein
VDIFKKKNTQKLISRYQANLFLLKSAASFSLLLFALLGSFGR